jgi:hypothetical protein
MVNGSLQISGAKKKAIRKKKLNVDPLLYTFHLNVNGKKEAGLGAWFKLECLPGPEFKIPVLQNKKQTNKQTNKKHP